MLPPHFFACGQGRPIRGLAYTETLRNRESGDIHELYGTGPDA